LIDEKYLEEFLAVTSQSFGAELDDILQRAISFALQSGNQSPEVFFLSLSAALESALTFFRQQDEYEILSTEEFSEVEQTHLNWVVERILLCVRGWLIERTNVRAEYLDTRVEHQNRQTERAKFA
jgi:hypothetical protein